MSRLAHESALSALPLARAAALRLFTVFVPVAGVPKPRIVPASPLSFLSRPGAAPLAHASPTGRVDLDTPAWWRAVGVYESTRRMAQWLATPDEADLAPSQIGDLSGFQPGLAGLCVSLRSPGTNTVRGVPAGYAHRRGRLVFDLTVDPASTVRELVRHSDPWVLDHMGQTDEGRDVLSMHLVDAPRYMDLSRLKYMTNAGVAKPPAQRHKPIQAPASASQPLQLPTPHPHPSSPAQPVLVDPGPISAVNHHQPTQPQVSAVEQTLASAPATGAMTLLQLVEWAVVTTRLLATRCRQAGDEAAARRATRLAARIAVVLDPGQFRGKSGGTTDATLADSTGAGGAQAGYDTGHDGGYDDY